MSGEGLRVSEDCLRVSVSERLSDGVDIWDEDDGERGGERCTGKFSRAEQGSGKKNYFTVRRRYRVNVGVELWTSLMERRRGDGEDDEGNGDEEDKGCGADWMTKVDKDFSTYIKRSINTILLRRRRRRPRGWSRRGGRGRTKPIPQATKPINHYSF